MSKDIIIEAVIVMAIYQVCSMLMLIKIVLAVDRLERNMK